MNAKAIAGMKHSQRLVTASGTAERNAAVTMIEQIVPTHAQPSAAIDGTNGNGSTLFLASQTDEELLQAVCIPPEVAAQLAEHISDSDLTTRREVLRQIACGNRNRDIGDLLFISEETLKVHV